MAEGKVMKVKIAIASSDGIVVNRHFGKAEKFYIAEADTEDYSYSIIEERDVTPVCKVEGHDDDALAAAVKNLSDCRYVIVSRIGFRAKDACEAGGLSVYEIPVTFDRAIEKTLRYEEVQKMISDSLGV